MREVRRHRPDRAARLALSAGGVGIAWAGASLLVGSATDAHADDGLLPPIVSTVSDAATDLVPPLPSPLPSPGDALSGLDLIPTLPVVDLPLVPALPSIPGTPQLPDLVPVPQLLPTPTGTLLSPVSGVAGDGSPAVTPTPPTAPSPGSAPSSPPADVPRLAGPAFGATPVAPPSSPAPPTPAPIASGSASELAPPPADRTSAPRAYFASFALSSHPGRGPPTGPSFDVDTSPD